MGNGEGGKKCVGGDGRNARCRRWEGVSGSVTVDMGGFEGREASCFGGSKDAKSGFANLVIGDVGAADDHRRRNGWEEWYMEW